MISSIQIAVNHNAPTGSDAISMYDTGTSGPLSLGQLVQAVCIRSAAAYEAQSVNKMNTMTAGSTKLDTAAAWLTKIVQGTADWTEAKAYLTGTLGIDASALPNSLDEDENETTCAYDRRILAANALMDKMNTLVQTQQEEMIDLESLVSRRDNAFATSSNIVRSLGTSSSGNAANF